MHRRPVNGPWIFTRRHGNRIIRAPGAMSVGQLPCHHAASVCVSDRSSPRTLLSTAILSSSTHLTLHDTPLGSGLGCRHIPINRHFGVAGGTRHWPRDGSRDAHCTLRRVVVEVLAAQRNNPRAFPVFHIDK